jgi:hypothetical protein
MRSSLSLVRTKVMGQTSAVMSIVWSGWIVIARNYTATAGRCRVALHA